MYLIIVRFITRLYHLPHIRISQADLAEAIGKGNKSISHIESGRSFPMVETLFDIADALEIPAAELILGLRKIKHSPASMKIQELVELLPVEDQELIISWIEGFINNKYKQSK